MQADATRILAALPQTQCTRCSYPDCAGYADAIAQGQAAINRCPPGGAEGVARLAEITAQSPAALDPECGAESPRALAVIDEDWCIGCTLCIAACPTDAILGGNKRMHTVIEAYCTGCELCIPVCPVDCIALENVSGTATGWAAWSAGQAELSRERYAFHLYRRGREETENAARLEQKAAEKLADLPGHSSITDVGALDRKKAILEAALERARARRKSVSGGGRV